MAVLSMANILMLMGFFFLIIKELRIIMKRILLALTIGLAILSSAQAKTPKKNSAPADTVKAVGLPLPAPAPSKELRTPYGTYTGAQEDGKPQGKGVLRVEKDCEIEGVQVAKGYIVRGTWEKGRLLKGEIRNPQGQTVRRINL